MREMLSLSPKCKTNPWSVLNLFLKAIFQPENPDSRASEKHFQDQIVMFIYKRMLIKLKRYA